MRPEKPSLTSQPVSAKHNAVVFAFFWIVLFILYLPAARAGMVGDFPGWLHYLKTFSFIDYINRAESHIASLYQFKQLCMYLFYKLFATNPWPWHVLYISMQALVGYLLFCLCRNVFTDTGISNAACIAFCGVLLFCVCPHITEVVVWNPAYHYMQAFALQLGILLLLHRYLYKQETKYAGWAALLFFLSTYTLEVFYLTPLLTITLAIYYRAGLQYNKAVCRKVLVYFLLPQLLLFITHLIVLKAMYGTGIARVGSEAFQPVVNYLQKPAKYIFHILFFGRFFPGDFRNKIYKWCDHTGMIITISIIIIAGSYILFRFRSFTARGKAIALLFTWTLLGFAIVAPMTFPDSLLVIFDRYTYFIDAFIYLLLSLCVSGIRSTYIRAFLFTGFLLVNLRFTIKVNHYWQWSAKMLSSLFSSYPGKDDKIVVLLNVPKCLKGVQMINAETEGQFKTLRNELYTRQVTGKVYDGMGYNMETIADGANVNVLNDTVVRVTLNQWGTWWWYGDLGGRSYENDDYKIDVKDAGRMYELTLKQKASNYMLLYQVGSKWRIVDMSKKNRTQD
ncbi:MAG: hypothetical protein H0X33_07240 [Taibaiella sp.]|nr:hypothetical protein [Taibaiella sp.]